MVTPMTEAMMRMMLGCLLYRLGGQQTFTGAEIHEICESIQGVQWHVDEDDNLTVIARTPEAVQGLEATQRVLHL
jgi:hypothetical protein